MSCCYCDYDALECRMRGHHGTPKMFAEYGKGGKFYSTHFLVWLTRTFFYFKYVG